MNNYTENDLTPWFPADIKPARVGIYERDYKSIGDPYKCFCEWDGKDWHLAQRLIGNCQDLPLSDYEKMPWRGLRFDPSAEAK